MPAMTDNIPSNLRILLIDARSFVGKSRCSVGHSVSEVLDRAKPGMWHCLYCKEQAALHERLMLAVSEATTCSAHETSAEPTDAALLELASQYDQGPGSTYEFDQETLLRLLRDVPGRNWRGLLETCVRGWQHGNDTAGPMIAAARALGMQPLEPTPRTGSWCPDGLGECDRGCTTTCSKAVARDAEKDSAPCSYCFGDKTVSMSDGSKRMCELCGGTGRVEVKASGPYDSAGRLREDWPLDSNGKPLARRHDPNCQYVTESGCPPCDCGAENGNGDG